MTKLRSQRRFFPPQVGHVMSLSVSSQNIFILVTLALSTLANRHIAFGPLPIRRRLYVRHWKIVARRRPIRPPANAQLGAVGSASRIFRILHRKSTGKTAANYSMKRESKIFAKQSVYHRINGAITIT